MSQPKGNAGKAASRDPRALPSMPLNMTLVTSFYLLDLSCVCFEEAPRVRCWGVPLCITVYLSLGLSALLANLAGRGSQAEGVLL